VQAGIPVEDARLDDIDLRGRVRQIELRIVTDRGEPVPGDEVAVASGSTHLGATGVEEIIWSGRKAWDGRFAAAVHIPVDLVISADGYETVSMQAVFEDRVVTLRASPRVQVQIAEWPQSLPEGVTPSMSLTPASVWWQQFHGSFAGVPPKLPVDDSGRAALSLRDRTTVHVTLSLSKGGKTTAIPLGSLDLSAARGGQVFFLAFDPAALERALLGLER
jgi:hypothetical protein